MVGPSIQADVIDYDEYKTGQRKEGAYFAAWNFVYKSATGITIMTTLWVLDIVGFMPNVEQTDGVKLAIISLYSLAPFACYVVGAGLLGRFSLRHEICDIDVAHRLVCHMFGRHRPTPVCEQHTPLALASPSASDGLELSEIWVERPIQRSTS